MPSKSLRLVPALLLINFLHAQEKSPVIGKWEQEITAIEKRLVSNPAPTGGIAFVGSSTMRMWNLEQSFPELKMANLGFGGSQIQDQIDLFDRLLLKLKPRQVIFYAGGNDLADKSTPERVAANFALWTQKMRALVPECRVVYLGIRHSSSRAQLRQKEMQANGLIREFCEKDTEKRLSFVDLNAALADAAGSVKEEFFLPDKLHLNSEGYKIWSARVRPLLDLKLPH